MTSAIAAWTEAAQQAGVFRYVLPFLIVFLVIYGVLERVSPFGGSNEQRIHAALAAVIALFVTAFTPAGPTMAAFLSNFLGAIAVVLVGLLGALVAAGLVWGEDFHGTGWARFLGGLAVVAVLAIFLAWGGLAVLFPSGAFGGVFPDFHLEELMGIAVVVGTIVFLYWALGESASAQGGGGGEQA